MTPLKHENKLGKRNRTIVAGNHKAYVHRYCPAPTGNASWLGILALHTTVAGDGRVLIVYKRSA